MNHSAIRQKKNYRFRYDSLKQYVEEQAGTKIMDIDFIKTIEKRLANILYYDKARDVLITVYDEDENTTAVSNEGEELTYTDQLIIKRQKGQELTDWEEQWLLDTRNSKVQR